MGSAPPDWLKANTAAKRLGCTVYRLNQMTLAGQIRTKVEPGATPRYSAEDVDRLAADRQPASA